MPEKGLGAILALLTYQLLDLRQVIQPLGDTVPRSAQWTSPSDNLAGPGWGLSEIGECLTQMHAQ